MAVSLFRKITFRSLLFAIALGFYTWLNSCVNLPVDLFRKQNRLAGT